VVPTWPKTGAVLDVLKKKYQLAIVTMGEPRFQMEKIKKSSLEPALFCKIVVTPIAKGPHYKALMEALSLAPQEVVVVGDKIENDLRPAKELGARTIHLKKGRGQAAQGAKEDVDRTIFEIEELLDIL
jgi:putative hydrolase of the HAD superfamily